MIWFEIWFDWSSIKVIWFGIWFDKTFETFIWFEIWFDQFFKTLIWFETWLNFMSLYRTPCCCVQLRPRESRRLPLLLYTNPSKFRHSQRGSPVRVGKPDDLKINSMISERDFSSQCLIVTSLGPHYVKKEFFLYCWPEFLQNHLLNHINYWPLTKVLQEVF